MAIFGDFFAFCIFSDRVQHISDRHFKFALRPHHVGSMVDIQCAAAEVRRGKKEDRGWKYNGLPYAIGRSQQTVYCALFKLLPKPLKLLLSQLSKFCQNYVSYTGTSLTRMWANAQRDGRPAEYRWCPLFKAAKFGRRPLLQCRAVMLARRELKLAGVPQTN